MESQTNPTSTDVAPTLTEATAQAASMRCKFQCVNVQDLSSGLVYQERVYMQPVIGTNVDGSPNENASFAAATPSGVLEMLIDNPDAQGFYRSGQQYYLDITPVNTQPAPEKPAV